MQLSASGCRLDVLRPSVSGSVENFNNVLSFSLLSDSQSRKRFLEDVVGKGFFSSLGAGVGDLVEKRYVYAFDFAFSLGIVEFTVDSGVFSGGVSIFFEVALDASGSLVDAAARSHVGLHLLLVVFDGSRLSDDYLLLCPQKHQSVTETSHKGLHFVLYSSSSVSL